MGRYVLIRLAASIPVVLGVVIAVFLMVRLVPGDPAAVTYAIDATLTFPMVAESGRVFSVEDIAERTRLVLSGRFAKVVGAEAVAI